MSIKTILVHMCNDEPSARALRMAASIAKARSASLLGCHITPNSYAAVAGMGEPVAAAAVISDIEESAAQEAADTKTMFTGILKEMEMPGEWRQVDAGMGPRNHEAATEGMYADLLVAGLPPADSKAAPSLAQDLVIETGRPLLLVPSSPADHTFEKNIMIAWNESREAARAVHDAMPFLRAAEKISIACIVERHESDAAESPADRLAGVLTRHNLNADVLSITADKDRKTSEMLFDAARNQGASMIVAGAYSNSRLVEGLFGGVTSALFSSTPVPTLVSH